MGVHLHLAAPLPAPGFLRRAPAAPVVLQQLAQAFREAVPDPDWREMVRVAQEDTALCCTLHPAEEPVIFYLTPRRQVHCQARTNSAGPGYHAYLVEVLDAVGKKRHLRWVEVEDGDESGYWTHRDFYRLQGTMMEWLQSVAQEIITGAYATCLLSYPSGMPAPLAPREEFFAGSSLGTWSREWLQQVAEVDSILLRSYAEEFYPWWEHGLNPEVWLRRGLALVWCEIPWHAPVTEAEHYCYRETLRALRKASVRASSPHYPHEAIAELEALARQTVPSTRPPAPQGIGYRRHTMVFGLPDGWTLPLPGYWYVEEGENGPIYYFDQQAVHVTTITARNHAGRPVPLNEIFPALKARIAQGGGEIIELQHDPATGFACLRQSEEDGRPCWQLCGAWGIDGNVCLTTLITAGLDDTAWAVETWQGIRYCGEPMEERTEGNTG